MKVSFSLKGRLTSLSMSTNRLPQSIIDSLIANRKFWRDLPKRLAILPVVHKGRYIGTMPESTPHENAVEFQRRNAEELDLCVGYVIWREEAMIPWKIEPHSFCVRKDDDRVVDPTEGRDWGKMKVYYLGFRVPKKDIPQMKYLNLFERMSYLLDHL